MATTGEEELAETESRDLDRTKVDAPEDWDVAVDFAGYILSGFNNTNASKLAGISRKTGTRYRQSTWWPKVLDEAARVARGEFVQNARETVKEAAKEDPDIAKWVMANMDPLVTSNKRRGRPNNPGGLSSLELTINTQNNVTSNSLTLEQQIQAADNPESAARSLKLIEDVKAKQLLYQQRVGELVDRQEVQIYLFETIRMARDRLLAMPVRVASTVPEELKDQVESTVREIVHETLEDLATRFEAMDEEFALGEEEDVLDVG